MTLNKLPPSMEDYAETKKALCGAALVDKNVQTTFGQGIVLEYRDDEVYVVKLTKNESDYSPLGILYTRDLPVRVKTLQEQTDELNVAYEALEKMRRMNLEMECFENGVTDVQVDHCTTCMMSQADKKSRFPRLQSLMDKTTSATKASTPSRPFLRTLWNAAPTDEKPKDAEETKPQAQNSRVVLPRIQRLLDERQKATASPCLICANPVCSQHSSPSFRKEGISLCLSCEQLFNLDFIVECVSNPDSAERAKRIDHMVDCYDRCLLLLKYSSQYADHIAKALEEQKGQSNRIGLGSSGVGVISGVLGIAAAASILTPAGPPLLIASLFFGGSATAVQTGSDAYNYFSEPNKLADRVIALHGMVLSILRVTSTLRDAMLRDHIRTDVFDAEPTPLTESVQDTLGKNRAGVLAGANVGRAATLGTVAPRAAVASTSVMASAEAGAAAGARGATALSRAGTAAARTLRFARFAGGALSAAVLVMEANSIQSTLTEIHNGSPCDKAERIREIAREVKTDALPSTSELDEECQAYLAALASRPQPPLEVAAEAVNTPVEELPQAECALAPPPEAGEVEVGTVILPANEEPAAVATAVPTSDPAPRQTLVGSGSSLLQRMQFRQHGPTTEPEDVNPVAADAERTQDPAISLVL